MAFSGDLANVNLFDVFQTLLQNRQDGVLVLQRGLLQKKLHLSPEGVRLLSAHGGRPLKVGEIFVQRGFVTPQDIEILLLEQKERYRPIGELLVATGKVAKDQVDSILRYHAEDEIYELFAWEDGTFAFHDGQDPESMQASPLSEVVLEPTSICLDAARRLDETARLREAIPTNEEFFTRVEGLVPDFKDCDPALADLYEALHAPHSVDELRDLVGLTLFDVLVGLDELLQQGTVRALEPGELVDIARAARERGEERRAAVVFEKAHEREPGDLGLLEETIQAVQRVGDHARLATLFTSLARIHAGQEAYEEAIEALERALRHEPDRIDLLEELKEVFAANGELDRAVETSLRIARMHEERGRMDDALATLHRGLELAPDRASLRLHLAQLYLRTDQADEARAELHGLVDAHEGSKRGRRSRHSRELLARCARLMLQIDAGDERAHQLMRTLEATSDEKLRRRRVVARLAIAIAAMVVLAGLGVTLMTGGATAALSEVREAHAAGDLARLDELVLAIEQSYPDTPEATRARELLEAARAEGTREDPRVAQRREKLAAAIAEAGSALKSDEYLNAVAAVPPLLEELKKAALPAATREDLANEATYLMVDFLDRVEQECRDDLRLVTEAEHVLRDRGAKRSLAEVRTVESDLDTIRKRDWPAIAQGMQGRLRRIAESRMLKVLEPRIEKCRKTLLELARGFEGVERLHRTAIAARLRHEIAVLVDAADREGAELLAQCELERARGIYQAAWNRIDSVYGYDPAPAIDELISQLERDGVRPAIRRRLRTIDSVIARLGTVEADAASGDPERVSAAFEGMRRLVFDHVRVGFYHRYRLPVWVASSPPGARVLVDGEPAGTTPTTLEVPLERTSTVTLRLDGFEDASAEVSLTDRGMDGRIEVLLRKEIAWRYALGDAVEATPVIAGDLLLVATSNCALHALDLATGEPRWPAARSGLLFNVKAAPFVVGDHAVFITSNGVLHRVRLSDGAVVDRHPLGGGVLVDVAQHGDTVWAATVDRRIVRLRLGDSVEQLAEAPLAVTPSTGLTWADGHIVFGTIAGELVVLDAADGRELRRVDAAPHSSFLGGIANLGDVVIAGSEAGRIGAWPLGRTDAEPLWSVHSSEPVSAPPVVVDGSVYVPTRNGILHALEAGGAHERFDLGGALLDRRPAAAGPILYLLGRRDVIAWDSGRRGRLWEYRFRDESPRFAVADGRHVIVVTAAPGIVAFPGDAR